jgi:hypothetical protein
LGRETQQYVIVIFVTEGLTVLPSVCITAG